MFQLESVTLRSLVALTSFKNKTGKIPSLMSSCPLTPFVKNSYCFKGLYSSCRRGRERCALNVLLDLDCSCNVDLKCRSLTNNLHRLLLSVLICTPMSNGCGDGGP